MFFERIAKLRHLLAFRLTLWYAAIFVLSASIAYVMIYFSLRSSIRDRVDEDLFIQSNEFETILTLQGPEMLQRAASIQAQAAGEKKMFFRFFYPSGVVFSSSNMSYWKTIGISRKAVDSIMRGEKRVYTTPIAKNGKHTVRILYSRVSDFVILQLGYSLESEYSLLLSFQRTFTVTMSVLGAVAVAVGWFMARRALSGVASVTRTARRISESDLKTRVPLLHRHNEIDQLALTFNQMLDRIQKLVAGTLQMNDNIAHDLRSPITRIRGLAEVTMINAGNLEEYRQMTAGTIEECDRLLSMINTMLTISRTEAGIGLGILEDLDFKALVWDACELFQPLAEDKGVMLAHQLEDVAPIKGNKAMLQRMVANLIDNAIKYTPCDGAVTVVLEAEDNANAVVLTVSDTGIGIPIEEQPKIFNRFYRCDQSRSQSGAGLGLSLARAIAYSHGGQIKVKSDLQAGSAFSVKLPV
ncbi:MAG: HAMP domain-containing protein [Desulfobacteraceae bacterium]|nr:HAMP domain-containing protein [Desulfobacteraceae bacterium]